jgi:hypothetical protein
MQIVTSFKSKYQISGQLESPDKYVDKMIITTAQRIDLDACQLIFILCLFDKISPTEN